LLAPRSGRAGGLASDGGSASGGTTGSGGTSSGGAAGNGGTSGSSGTRGNATSGGAGGPASTPVPICTLCNGMCVDIQTDDRNCGGCDVACTAAAPSAARCANGRCLVTLAADQIEPASLAVDGTSVYWATQPYAKGTVMKVALAGGAPQTLASDQNGPSNVVASGNEVFWAYFPRTIASAPVEGGPPTTLASEIRYFFSFAVDATSLYWLLDSGWESTVVKMPRTGGPQTRLAVQGHGGGRGLAVDATGVYWTDNGTPDNVALGHESAVFQVPLDGGTVTALASGQGVARGVILDATNVYWTAWRIETGSVLMRMPKTGGTPSAVASAGDSCSFAVDETSAYWADTVGGVVMRAPLGGGVPTTLASDQRHPNHIAVDATSVYWTNEGSPMMGTPDGAVMKLFPK
jgi:hypothetical protein